MAFVAGCSKSTPAPAPASQATAAPVQSSASAPPPATSAAMPPAQAQGSTQGRSADATRPEARGSARTDTDIPSASKADVVTAAATRELSMTVGQTLGILPTAGGPGVTWQVDFDPDRFALLTPRDRLAAPGDHGWVWRAVAPGDAQVTLTSRPPCPRLPCESNPMQVTVTVTIKPRLGEDSPEFWR